MKILNTIAIASAIAAVMLLASTDSRSQDDCEGNHTIQVAPGADGMPELTYRGGSAEEIRVCNGDQVQWVLRGSDREYFVDFMGNAPFSGAARRGSSDGVVSVTIEAEVGSYDYGVNFEGDEPMDPQLIVHR
ncbi:MAG: hypothetical protein OEV16_14730 [Gammaproteobacteria bacterium]|jgi:hypothetical protein|nr:hypothetical protein [Gammaproteobacteria bacterium]MDH4006260.1 hypothetical protein [Gammaproteobacteria bacterium]